MNPDLSTEIAEAAARLIAEEGLPWGPAKHKALRALDLPTRTALPSNEQVEDALREHLALFQADTQPTELRQLRELALRWMERLADFEPLLTGAVWRGTANRWSDIHLQLHSDDPKAPEIFLINAGESPEPGDALHDARGEALTTLWIGLRPPPGFDHPVALQLTVHDHRGRHGALKPDPQGRPLRGDTRALRRLLELPDAAP